jgi:hypothetical protein
MSNEEIQKKMEFIVRKQIEVREGLEKLRLSHDRAEARMGPFLDALGLYGELSFELPNRDDENINRIREAQIKVKNDLRDFVALIARYLSANDGDQSPLSN